jgi:hypothetical protein
MDDTSSSRQPTHHRLRRRDSQSVWRPVVPLYHLYHLRNLQFIGIVTCARLSSPSRLSVSVLETRHNPTFEYHQPLFSKPCISCNPSVMRLQTNYHNRTKNLQTIPSLLYLTLYSPKHCLPLESTSHSHTFFSVATNNLSPHSSQSSPNKSVGSFASCGKYAELD